MTKRQELIERFGRELARTADLIDLDNLQHEVDFDQMVDELVDNYKGDFDFDKIDYKRFRFAVREYGAKYFLQIIKRRRELAK